MASQIKKQKVAVPREGGVRIAAGFVALLLGAPLEPFLLPSPAFIRRTVQATMRHTNGPCGNSFSVRQPRHISR
jgi:hypothetical protein